jgi:transcriptional antiterminator NusG
VGENGENWFVVHTYSGHEDRVKKNLEQRIKLMTSGDEISQVVVPTEEEVEVRGGQMRMSDQSLNIVLNTPGVTGFVGSGNRPVPLREEEVSQIMKQMQAETPKVKVGFKQGQSVRVTDGPFVDFVGVVDEISADKGKVKVLLSLFGRDTPVELDFLQVEKL